MLLLRVKSFFGFGILDNVIDKKIHLPGDPATDAGEMINTFNKTNSAGMLMQGDFQYADPTANKVNLNLLDSKSTYKVTYKKEENDGH